jgi:hypothetical protein
MLNKKLITALRARDQLCWHCGEQDDLVPHHRRNRGSGGSRLLDTLDNLMMVCARYNGEMESVSSVAQSARELGHKLSKFDKSNPPAFDKTTGIWFTLTEAGEKLPTEVERGLW